MTVSDGQVSDSELLQITITDVNEPPVFIQNSYSISGNEGPVRLYIYIFILYIFVTVNYMIIPPLKEVALMTEQPKTTTYRKQSVQDKITSSTHRKTYKTRLKNYNERTSSGKFNHTFSNKTPTMPLIGCPVSVEEYAERIHHIG